MMNYKGFISGILVVAATVTATSVLAEGRMHPRPEPISFESLDTNGDGGITMEEMQAHRMDRFNEGDANGDGVLDRDEMLAGAMKRAEARVDGMIERFDKDGDGMISAEEMPQPPKDRAERMFNRVDANDDGAISEEEFAQMQERMKERHGDGHMKRGDKGEMKPAPQD